MKVYLLCILFLSFFLETAGQTADFSLNNANNEFCFNDTVIFTNNSTSYTNQKWDFGDGYESYFKNPKHIYLQTGNYTVTLTVYDNSGNQNSISKDISVYELPTLSINPANDTTIYTGTSIKLTASGNFDEVIWSNGKTTEEITVNTAGTFSIIASENTHSCKNKDTITISLKNIEESSIKIETLNNILTPNSDGVNDFLFIKDLDNIKLPCEISIYGKSGNLLFHDNDYKNNWNGQTTTGIKLTSGTYYYIIKIAEKIGGTGFVDILF